MGSARNVTAHTPPANKRVLTTTISQKLPKLSRTELCRFRNRAHFHTAAGPRLGEPQRPPYDAGPGSLWSPGERVRPEVRSELSDLEYADCKRLKLMQ